MATLSKHTPDGTPSDTLAQVVDALIEASIPDTYKTASSCLAVDWTDLETWALGPHSDGATADLEASWGHRRLRAIGQADEVFYGYYFSTATMVQDELGRALPELIGRITLTTCSVDPVPAIVAVLERLAHSGVTLGDILADSAYAQSRGGKPQSKDRAVTAHLGAPTGQPEDPPAWASQPNVKMVGGRM